MKKALWFIIALSVVSVFSKDTLLTVTPYAHGEIIVPYNVRYITPNSWYADTITFSSGTRITFMELLQMFFCSDMLGGLLFIDTMSSMYYKFDDSMRVNSTIDPANLSQGMNSITSCSPDTNWNEAMNVPDSLVSCDTFVYDNSNNGDSVRCVKARPVYTHYWRCTVDKKYTWIEEGYNTIAYIRDTNNFHLKMQVYQFKSKWVPSMNNDTVPDTVKVLWAADSCGNGVFKHGIVSNRLNGGAKPGTNNLFLSNNIKGTSLHLPSVLLPEKRVTIDIYDLAGKKIARKHITGSEPVNLSGLNSGMYIAHITAGRVKIVHPFLITR